MRLTTLPVETRRIDDAHLTRLGFVLGAPNPDDPQHRPATLPDGWTHHPPEHADAAHHGLWSFIDDEHGRRRFAVCHKSRHGTPPHLRAITVDSYIRSVYLRRGRSTDVILDPDWATPDAVDAAARDLIADTNRALVWLKSDRQHCAELRQQRDDLEALVWRCAEWTEPDNTRQETNR